MAASPAWEYNLAVACALRLLLPPGDCAPMQEAPPVPSLTTSAPPKSRSGSNQLLPPQVYIICGLLKNTHAVIPPPGKQDQNIKVGERGLE